MENGYKKEDDTFYVVMDKRTGWSCGKTRNEAIAKAARWLKDEHGRQGVTPEQAETMIISEEEARDGANGIFIYKVTGHQKPTVSPPSPPAPDDSQKGQKRLSDDQH